MTSSTIPGVAIDSASVHREVLSNGLTVLVRRDASAPVVAIVTHVKAGYFDETDDVVGIAHVLEHMFFKGTDARGVGEIAKQTKAIGGYLNASTIYDHTVYYTVLPSTGFAAGLDIQADAYARSLIDASELAKELEVIIQEAKRKADNPSAVATETLYELLHDRHRIRRWRIGREPGLRALSRDDLVRFYRNFYRPSATILSIVGDVDVDEAMQLVERHYGSLPDAPIERSPGATEVRSPGFRYRELAGDIAQTEMTFGWRTPGTLHADTPALDIAASLLGTGRASRLYRAVRERQLAASVSAYNYTPTEIGVFVIHTETPPQTMAEAARAIIAQVRELREEGAAANEIERARRTFESRWLRRLETMEGQANYLAEWEALGDWTLGGRYYERMVTASADEVTDAVRRYLIDDETGWVTYRPQSSAPLASDSREARALLEAGQPAPLPPSPEQSAPAVIARLGARLEREEAGVLVFRTDAGIPVLVRRRPGSPIVHLGLFAVGGSSIEPATKAGLTTLLARTSLKGTERRSTAQIAEDSELLGGGIGWSVTSDGFGWTLSVPRPHAVAALELLADVTQHPVFPEGELDVERTVALANVAMLRDDMYRYPLRLATEAAFAGHPYALPALGTETTLPSITADDVRGWHRAHVLESPVVVAIVGDVDADEMASLSAGAFALLRPADPAPLEAPRWPERIVSSAESRDKAQTALAIGFPSPSRGDDDRFAAQLIAGVASGLGGRFFDELRDRQSLGYTVHALTSERRRAGMFLAYIGTSPEKEEVARRGLLSEFARLRHQPVTDEELDRARTYALGSHAIRQQSGGAVLGDLVEAWLYGRGPVELGEYEAQLRRVTPSRILALADRYFDEERRVEGIVRGTGRKV